MRLAALLALVAAVSATELTAVDYMRTKFYRLEEELWKNVTDPEWSVGGAGGDVELTKAFAAFDVQLQAIGRARRPPLESWLWVKAVERFQIIDGYYKEFVSFVRRQSAAGAVPAPVREWLDLAEGILMDPKSSVAQAVRKIHDLLEQGNMFRGTFQVVAADIGTDTKVGRVSPTSWLYSGYEPFLAISRRFNDIIMLLLYDST